MHCDAFWREWVEARVGATRMQGGRHLPFELRAWTLGELVVGRLEALVGDSERAGGGAAWERLVRTALRERITAETLAAIWSSEEGQPSRRLIGGPELLRRLGQLGAAVEAARSEAAQTAPSADFKQRCVYLATNGEVLRVLLSDAGPAFVAQLRGEPDEALDMLGAVAAKLKIVGMVAHQAGERSSKAEISRGSAADVEFVVLLADRNGRPDAEQLVCGRYPWLPVGSWVVATVANPLPKELDQRTAVQIASEHVRRWRQLPPDADVGELSVRYEAAGGGYAFLEVHAHGVPRHTTDVDAQTLARLVAGASVDASRRRASLASLPADEVDLAAMRRFGADALAAVDLLRQALSAAAGEDRVVSAVRDELERLAVGAANHLEGMSRERHASAADELLDIGITILDKAHGAYGGDRTRLTLAELSKAAGLKKLPPKDAKPETKIAAFGRAIPDFERAIRLAPDNPAYKRELAVTLHNRACEQATLGRHRDAIADFDRSLAAGTDASEQAITYRMRAHSRIEMKDLGTAISDLLAAVKLPCDQGTRCNLLQDIAYCARTRSVQTANAVVARHNSPYVSVSDGDLADIGRAAQDIQLAMEAVAARDKEGCPATTGGTSGNDLRGDLQAVQNIEAQLRRKRGR